MPPQDVRLTKAGIEQFLVGKRLVAERPGQDEFCAAQLGLSHRLLRPGARITLDYESGRLNVHLTHDNMCSGVTWG